MNHKIEVITREGCEYCDKAKELLSSVKMEYTELHIGLDILREDVMTKYPEQKMLPVVVIDDELIGGYVELLDWLYPPMVVPIEEDNE